MRVAYPMTAAMPGILPRTQFSLEGDVLVLHLPADFAFLNGDHLRNRLRQFAEAAGHADCRVEVG
jgi:exopolyphosphatase / guanosine-5'-triphosphate,3'-diphosphate pyrophosphatase